MALNKTLIPAAGVQREMITIPPVAPDVTTAAKIQQEMVMNKNVNPAAHNVTTAARPSRKQFNHPHHSCTQRQRFSIKENQGGQAQNGPLILLQAVNSQNPRRPSEYNILASPPDKYARI